MQRDWQSLTADLAPDADPALVAQLHTTLDELAAWERQIPSAQSCDIAVATQRTLDEARRLATRLNLPLD